MTEYLINAVNEIKTLVSESENAETLTQILQATKIQAQLDIITALYDDFVIDDITKIVKVASDQLGDIVDDVYTQLVRIEDELEYHKTRYFSYLRTPYIDSPTRKLERLHPEMSKKVEFFVTAINIFYVKEDQYVPASVSAPSKSFLEKLLD